MIIYTKPGTTSRVHLHNFGEKLRFRFGFEKWLDVDAAIMMNLKGEQPALYEIGDRLIDARDALKAQELADAMELSAKLGTRGKGNE
jgi:hypothetical protein